jgi:hypothetical protein
MSPSRDSRWIVPTVSHERPTGRVTRIVGATMLALGAGLAILAIPSAGHTSPSSAPCKDSLLFAAAKAHEGFSTTRGYSNISPAGASDAICDAGWAVAAVSRPNVGTTDGFTLFRSVALRWREVGTLGGSVAACEMKQYQVPNKVALVLAHGRVHSGLAGC